MAIGQDFFSETKTSYKLLKGIDITRYIVRSHRWLKNYSKLKWENVEVFLKPKVISQVIVAHIENPYPHLKITACYDDEGIAMTNTLMAFETNKGIELKFLLCYLNSKFVSWYAFNFIYAQAIRTMHFYDFYIQQLPVPIMSEVEQKPFLTIVDKVLSAKSNNPEVEIKHLEDKIDIMIYNLYNLSYEEVKIIDPAFALTDREYENFKVE